MLAGFLTTYPGKWVTAPHRHQGKNVKPVDHAENLMLATERKLFFREQRFACFRAAATSFHANTAMFHVLAMFLADRTAAFAGLHASAQLCAGNLEIGAGESRDDPRSR